MSKSCFPFLSKRWRKLYCHWNFYACSASIIYRCFSSQGERIVVSNSPSIQETSLINLIFQLRFLNSNKHHNSFYLYVKTLHLRTRPIAQAPSLIKHNFFFSSRKSIFSIFVCIYPKYDRIIDTRTCNCFKHFFLKKKTLLIAYNEIPSFYKKSTTITINR